MTHKEPVLWPEVSLGRAGAALTLTGERRADFRAPETSAVWYVKSSTREGCYAQLNPQITKGGEGETVVPRNREKNMKSNMASVDDTQLTARGVSSVGFPASSPALEKFGLKFTFGGAHISRTMMMQELSTVLAHVSVGSSASGYREAILQQNILNKTTDSTRQKSLRHLRELYALDEDIPIFGLLRKLHAIDGSSVSLLAIQVAWSRDPLLRATTLPVLDSAEGDQVETASLAQALEITFPSQYSELNRNKIARNASSSWTQSGHLSGRAKKIRRRIEPTAVAVAMALFIGDVAGYQGAAAFSNPWCRLLDLNPDRAKAFGFEAHRAGLINLRAVGEVIELSFPMFAEFQERQP